LKPDCKLKKRIENIVSLNESWCKKKIVFADPLLPFGTVGEAYAHFTHPEKPTSLYNSYFFGKSAIFPTALIEIEFCCILQLLYKFGKHFMNLAIK
jgi:hypothetical protein